MPMIEPRLNWTPSLIGLSPPSFYGGFFGPLQPLGPSYTPRWRHLGDEGGGGVWATCPPRGVASDACESEQMIMGSSSKDGCFRRCCFAVLGATISDR